VCPNADSACGSPGTYARLIEVQIASQAAAGGEIVVVTLTGHADPASMHALIADLQAMAHRHDGMLRILVDETSLGSGRVGIDDISVLVQEWRKATALRSSRIAVIASNPIVRGLNQMFRLAANLERKDSLNAFSKRADAVAWLMS
jgi:hypothetical protein